MDVRRLTRTEARRIAIRAQLLDANRPPDLGALVDRLTLLQLDPTADRQASRLNVQAVRQDIPFTPVVTDAVNAELEALAKWLGLDQVRYP